LVSSGNNAKLTKVYINGITLIEYKGHHSNSTESIRVQFSVKKPAVMVAG